jgi:hypothetical protein
VPPELLPPVPVVPPDPEPPLPPLPVVPPELLPPLPVDPPELEPPLPVDPPEPVLETQLPFEQVVPPVQAWPQLPQLLLLEVVSMQVPLHSCWPETLQPHEPLLQEAPLPQAVQLDPQWAESVFELQAPSEHMLLPDGHDDEQFPLLQTWPLPHLLPQVPQLSVFEATHEPLQESSPPAQTQDPPLQVWPLPQTLPQAPQFWLSLCTFAHDPLHSIWLELQVGPVVPVEGLAHPVTTSAAPSTATQAKRDEVLESILNSLWGIGATRKAPPPGDGE